MPDSEQEVLICLRCQREYPLGTKICSADDGELVVKTPDPLIGTLFAEKYEILSLLGEGGMSKVYKAKHKFMERVVAIKLLHEHTTSDPTARARFQQEARAASALSHQNVVTVHDFGFCPNGQAFFIMDCLEGKSLSEILERKGRLNLETALEIFTQGCDGLDHAHRKGIIHRDIKPSNLVVIPQEDGNDLVKLVDFGIAKLMRPDADGGKPRNLTQTGEIFGTPAYMSPEQCNGRPLDARSDLYSFGCLMYEALAGDPPLVGDTFITTVVKQINEKPETLSEKAPHARVPAHLETVIMKCLEKNPDNRYATAAELKQALYDAAFAAGIKGLRVGAVPEPRHSASLQGFSRSGSDPAVHDEKFKQRKRWKLLAGLVATVVLGGAGAWWFFLNPGPVGDSGPVFFKILWQSKMSTAESLVAEKKFSEAQKLLEECRDMSLKFGDDNRRLEASLDQLVDVYDANHDYANLEAANKALNRIANEKVFREFDSLMLLLKQWQQPTTSETKRLERQAQAVAFAERIARCADKVSARSRDKQEVLLLNAIHVFDTMGMKDTLSSIKFRLGLADCLRAQQRYREMRTALVEAENSCPDKPTTAEDWRAKITVQVLLGQVERNEATDNGQLLKAKAHFEQAIQWLKAYLPKESTLLRDAYNGLAVLHRMMHDTAKAKYYEDLARPIEKKLDAEALKS